MRFSVSSVLSNNIHKPFVLIPSFVLFPKAEAQFIRQHRFITEKSRDLVCQGKAQEHHQNQKDLYKTGTDI